MTLHIDQVDAQMEILANRSSGETTLDVFNAPDTVLRERLRPIVLEILEEEIQRLRREAG